jgi:hypothetical protein
MGHLYADTDAKFRNDVLSNTKHLIERMRGATAYLMREIDRLAPTQGAEHSVDATVMKDLLKAHEDFLLWFIHFLFEELVSTASYQRHITSLRALILLLHSGLQKEISSVDRPAQVVDHATSWPYDREIFTPVSTRLLLDLLMDPFEDVRSGASMLLRMAHRRNFDSAEDTCDTPDLYILTEFIDRAKDLSKRTGRADYADGVARSYEILYRLQGSAEARMFLLRDLISNLESKVEIAKKDLTNAVLIAPIHGDFAALK